MTARGDLIGTLTNLYARTRNGRMDAHKAEAERLVDAVLHEAAERLRRLVTHAEDPWKCLPCATHLYDADLIDPKV